MNNDQSTLDYINALIDERESYKKQRDALLAAVRMVEKAPFEYTTADAYGGGTSGAFQMPGSTMAVVREAISLCESEKGVKPR